MSLLRVSIVASLGSGIKFSITVPLKTKPFYGITEIS